MGFVLFDLMFSVECFEDRCLFFFWPLCPLSLFDLRILISSLVSSNCSYSSKQLVHDLLKNNICVTSRSNVQETNLSNCLSCQVAQNAILGK